MRVIFYDHTDKLRHGNAEPTESLLRAAGPERRRDPARARDAATHGMIGAPRSRR